MERRPPLRRSRRAQALAGVLILVALLAALTAGLMGLAIEGQLAGSAARSQLAGQAIAELAINVGIRVLRDTVNSAFAQNLQTVQSSRAQGWVTQSGSPCTWSGVVSQASDIFGHYSPLTPGQMPNQIQTPSPPNTASSISLRGLAAGPGAKAYTWRVTVGLEAVPAPCPTWQDNGVTRVMTFPIGVFAFAWVWDPQGTLIGEMSDYTVPQTPGALVLTYQDCPPYFTDPACQLPTSVQVTLPMGQLLWNDPNVSTPPTP